MAFDVLVANPGRLRILTALAAEPAQEFVRLRNVTRLTDGNLCTHARRLARGGLVNIRKLFQNGKPITFIDLTPRGREALQTHAQSVLDALTRPATSEPTDEPPVDDWVD